MEHKKKWINSETIYLLGDEEEEEGEKNATIHTYMKKERKESQTDHHFIDSIHSQ